MPLEIEIRFRFPDERSKERLEADQLVRQLQMRDFKDIAMTAEYYDSPNHELLGMRATLRRRCENGLPRVSFKIAAPEVSGTAYLARRKWECAADDVSIAIGLLRDMGAPEQLSGIARSDGFLPRGSFEYVRHSVPLMLPEGTSVELDIDRGFLFAGGKREEMLEVALKLLYGDPSHLEELAAALEQKYELTRELSGKYERALRLLRSRK